MQKETMPAERLNSEQEQIGKERHEQVIKKDMERKTEEFKKELVARVNEIRSSMKKVKEVDSLESMREELERIQEKIVDGVIVAVRKFGLATEMWLCKVNKVRYCRISEHDIWLGFFGQTLKLDIGFTGPEFYLVYDLDGTANPVAIRVEEKQVNIGCGDMVGIIPAKVEEAGGAPNPISQTT